MTIEQTFPLDGGVVLGRFKGTEPTRRRCGMMLAVLAWLMVGLWPVGAGAAQLHGLYEAKVPVAAQHAAERQRAMKEALAAVVVKVTGDRQAPQKAPVQTAIDQAAHYVQQYRYESVPIEEPANSGGDETDSEEAASGEENASEDATTEPPKREQQVLWARFDARAVNRVLEKAQLPVWGRTRPAMLVWLAVEGDAGRYLLDPALHPQLRHTVAEYAQERGLPVLFPLMDLMDQSNITATDVWGGFEERIRAASERYRADTILVGRVRQVRQDAWQARWALYLNEDMLRWSGRRPSLDQAVGTGIDGAAGKLAERYAQVLSAGVNESLLLAVEEVAGLKQYTKVLRYLKSVDQVANVRVDRVEHDRVWFQVDLRGGRPGFVQTIGIGEVLGPPRSRLATGGEAPWFSEPSAAEPSEQVADLTYRLLP